MKILNVQLKHTHGGNPQVCLNYTQMLCEHHHEVFVLLNPLDPFIGEHQEYGAEVVLAKRLGRMGAYDLLAIMHFKGLIAKIKPDIIIVHEGRSAALIKRAAGKFVPVIDVNHGRGCRQSRLTDATLVTNSTQLKNTQKKLGSGHKTILLPNAIDLSDEDAPDLPKKWQKPPIIGTLGRLVNDKAIDVFIDALNILHKQGVNFSAVIAGDGEEKENLKDRILRYNLQNMVSMPGWIQKPDEFYKSINIFCFPSRKEEFGLVLLEAWKSGLPVVTSDADGAVDITTNKVNTLMVQKNNAIELADALKTVLNDKKYADTLAKSGYKTLEKYSISAIALQLNDILEEVLTSFNAERKSKQEAA